MRYLVTTLLILGGAWSGPCATAESDPSPYATYYEVRRMYDEAMRSENCAEIQIVDVMFKELRRSKAAIPEELAAAMQVNRPELGSWIRSAQRQLKGRYAELCRRPSAPPVERAVADIAVINQAFSKGSQTEDCAMVRGAAREMIAEADRKLAGHTLELIEQLQQARSECFP